MFFFSSLGSIVFVQDRRKLNYNICIFGVFLLLRNASISVFLCIIVVNLIPSLLFFYHPFVFIDLRDDKQFFVDHPGAVPITTAQV